MKLKNEIVRVITYVIRKEMLQFHSDNIFTATTSIDFQTFQILFYEFTFYNLPLIFYRRYFPFILLYFYFT